MVGVVAAADAADHVAVVVVVVEVEVRKMVVLGVVVASDAFVAVSTETQSHVARKGHS